MTVLNNIEWDRLTERLEAIVSTGSPGLYRVVSFLFVQHVYSLADLGRTASSMAIAQMAGFFTAIGWATLILVRLPGVAGRRAGIDAFYGLTFQALLTTILVTLGAVGVAISSHHLIHFDLSAVVTLLWSWTAYQMARHYFIAFKRYRIAILFDIVLVVVSGGALLVCRALMLSSSLALGIASLAVALPMFMLIGVPSRASMRPALEPTGIQFGLTNFLSGGISLVFVPAATAMCGAAFAGMLSLLSSLANVSMLLPRAISVMKIPELATRRSTGQPLDDTLRAMRNSIRWANGLVSSANMAVVLIIAMQRTPVPAQRLTVVVAGLLLTVLCAVGVMGLVNSNAMAVFEKGGASASINIATTSLFAMLFMVCTWMGGERGFLLVLASAITVTVLRNELIRMRAHAACRDYISRTLTVVEGSR